MLGARTRQEHKIRTGTDTTKTNVRIPFNLMQIAMSNYFYIIVFITIACLSMKHYVEGFGRAIRHEGYNNRTITDTAYLLGDRNTAESLIDCTRSCRARRECMSFSYNSISQECVMFSTAYVITMLTAAESGWAYYVYGGNECPIYKSFTHDRMSGLCFFALTNPGTFATTQNSCQQNYNASIISLDTAEKVSSLLKVLNAFPLTVIFRIGLTSSDGGVSWTWENGATLNVSQADWEIGQPKCPTSGNCDCVELNKIGWKWQVGCCKTSLVAICEYSM